MTASPIIKKIAILAFAAALAASFSSPAGAREKFGTHFNQQHEQWNDEQLENDSPDFDKVLHYYETDRITKKQFLKYVREHKDL